MDISTLFLVITIIVSFVGGQLLMYLFLYGKNWIRSSNEYYAARVSEGLSVPKEWNGLRIRVEVSAATTEDYFMDEKFRLRDADGRPVAEFRVEKIHFLDYVIGLDNDAKKAEKLTRR